MTRIKQNWSVYIIYCSDNTLYTGISTDTLRRFQQHADQKGAKYFRGRQPERIIYIENDHTRSSASQREASIKRLSRIEKNCLIHSDKNEIKQDEDSIPGTI